MKRFPTLSVLLSGILWGVMGLYVRTLSEAGFSSMDVISIRSLVTTIGMGAFLLCTDPGKLRVKWRDLWCFFGTGVVSILFFNYCYFTAMHFTSLSVACILMYTAPAFVMLFSLVLFRERITRKKVAALICAFVGCVLVTGIGGDAPLTWQGLLLGLGSGVGYALYSVFGRFALDRGYAPYTITFYTFLFSFVGSLFLTDFPALLVRSAQQPQLLPLEIFMGLSTGAVAYVLYTEGLSRMDPSRASILATVEPVVATLVGIFVFGEAPTVMAAAGVLLVLGSMLLLHEKQKKESAH